MTQKIHKTYWWLSPTMISLGFVIPIISISFILGDNFGSELFRLSSSPYFTLEYFLLATFTVIIFSLGSLTGQIAPSKKIHASYALHPKYVLVIGCLTVIAYLVWFYPLLLHPRFLLNFLYAQESAVYTIRFHLSTIPGITTLTQLGIIYVTAYFLDRHNLPDYYNKKRYRYLLYIILLLTIFRMFAWGERLALIEILLPIIVIFFTQYRPRSRSIYFISLPGPYIGIALLIILFAITEYFRSWHHYSHVSDSLFSFTIDRVFFYYFTSLNNGAGLLSELTWPEYKGFYTLNWLYNFPIIGEYLANLAQLNTVTGSFLHFYADMEFNNMSGIFVVFYDWGLIIGFILFYAFGAISGKSYTDFRFNSSWLRYLYPTLYIAFLEIPRIPYVLTGRYFPVILFIVIGTLFFRINYKPKSMPLSK